MGRSLTKLKKQVSRDSNELRTQQVRFSTILNKDLENINLPCQR